MVSESEAGKVSDVSGVTLSNLVVSLSLCRLGAGDAQDAVDGVRGPLEGGGCRGCAGLVRRGRGVGDHRGRGRLRLGLRAAPV